MPKLLIIFFFVFGFSYSLFGQDIIVLQNGEEIKVIVKEVGTQEIKYVKFDNQNGPLYAESKSNVFMIKYENGTKDVFSNKTNNENSKVQPTEKTLQNNSNESEESELLGVKQGFWSLKYYKGGNRINRVDFVRTLQTDPEAYAYYSRYGTTKIIERFFGGLSLLGAIFTVSFSINMQNQPALVSAIGGLLAGVIARVYDSRAKSNLELAVLTYNKNLEN